MAYGLKYELLCASKDGNTYKLRLLFDGYVGAQIDRNITADSPLVLRKDRSKALIRGTSLEFSIREIVDFEMDEFYTNNPKKIKAELYRGSTLLWTGYNLPQQYQAEYVPAPVNIKFTATDGLGLLKNEKFNLTGRNSQIATLVYCIDKIGLGLSYSIAINFFETNHLHTISPLEQTFEDSACFNGKYCNDVIEEILKKYNAEITQVNGKWYITRSADKESVRMLYNAAGVYTGTEAAPAVLDLGYKGAGIEVWPVGRLSRGLEPGAKQVTLSYDFGRKASYLNNYDFWRYSGGQFEGWTQTGSFTLSQFIKDGKAYAHLSGYSNYNTQKISQQIPITKVTNEDFVFEIGFAPMGSARSTLSAGTILMNVRMVVSLSDGVTPYYLTKTGWTTTLSEISETVQSSISSPVWNKLKIVTGEPPVSGTLLVSLFRFYFSGTPRPGDVYNGIAFSEPLVYLLRGGALYPSGVKTIAVFDNSTEPEDMGDESILTGDAPDYDNKAQLYKNITRLLDGTPTALWHVLGETATYSQLIQLARILASDNRIARQKLSGVIKGTTLSFTSIIQHAHNGNRKFEIAEGSWDIYNGPWQITLLEILAWSSEPITFTDDSANLSTPETNQTGGGAIVVGTIGNDAGKNILVDWFDLINPGEETEYLLCKKPLAGVSEITAFTTAGYVPPSLWDSLPYATAGSVGGIKVGSGLSITNGVLSVTGGAGMTYPGAGIAISTGSAWGTSITNNSANWNAAYTWVYNYGYTDYVRTGDSRLTDARTPVSHTHGNITNAGYLGSTANIPLITGVSGIVQAGSFGTAVNTFCQGNDSRLSDNRNASDVYTWAKQFTKPSYSASEVGLGNVTNESKATMFTSPTFTGLVNINTPNDGSNILRIGNGANIGYIFKRISADGALSIQGEQAGHNNILLCPTGGNVGLGTSNAVVKLTLFDNNTLGSTIGNYQGITRVGSWVNGNALVKQEATLRVRTGSDWPTAGWFSFVHVDGYADVPMSSSRMWELIDIYDYKRKWGCGANTHLMLDSYNGPTLTMYGNIDATGEVTAYYSSDRRLKQDINYQWSGLDLIDKMRPATYHWNSLMKGLNSSKDDRINYGMIADEMANVTPDLIHTIYEKYQSVDYVQVIPILVKAIKELREEVNQLKYK